MAGTIVARGWNCCQAVLEVRIRAVRVDIRILAEVAAVDHVGVLVEVATTVARKDVAVLEAALVGHLAEEDNRFLV